MLTARLTTLVDHGVLERVRYQEHPERFDYRLTAKGRDLWPVLNAVREWGDRWAAPDGPPLQIRHQACGHVVHAVATCSSCGEPLDARNVRTVAGPGAPGGDLIPTR